MFKSSKRKGDQDPTEKEILRRILRRDPDITKDDQVFQFVATHIPGLVTAANSVISKPVVVIRTAEQLTEFRESLQRDLSAAFEQHRRDILSAASSVGRDRKAIKQRKNKNSAKKPIVFAQDQLQLIDKAHRLNSFHFTNFCVTKQTRTAMQYLLMAAVEAECAAEDDNIATALAQDADAFATTCSGFQTSFSLSDYLAIDGVKKRAVYRVRHAGLGRLLRWADSLQKTIGKMPSPPEPSVVFWPIQTLFQMNQLDEHAVIEFFMRAAYAQLQHSVEMYAAGTENDVSLREAKVKKHFSILVNAKMAQRVVFTEAGKQEDQKRTLNDQCPRIVDTQCLTVHSRRHINTAIKHPLSVFDMMTIYDGQVLGSASMMKESARCLPIVWLELLRQVYACVHQVESVAACGEPAPTEFSGKTLATYVLMASGALPGPRPVEALVHQWLVPFMQAQCRSVLLDTGLDLDCTGLISSAICLAQNVTDVFANFHKVPTMHVVEKSRQQIENIRAAAAAAGNMKIQG